MQKEYLGTGKRLKFSKVPKVQPPVQKSIAVQCYRGTNVLGSAHLWQY